MQKLTEKAAEVRNLKYRFCAILCEQWKSTYLFNGFNCLHCLYKNVSILLCLSKLLMFVCMYISILLLLFYFLVTLLNNVLEYSMCRLMFLNRIIFDFSAYHHFLNLEDGNVGEESPVDIAALALFFTSFTFLFSHPVWDCNFQKSDDYILPIFQRGVIQTISPVTTRVNGVLTSLSLPFPFLIHSYI